MTSEPFVRVGVAVVVHRFGGVLMGLRKGGAGAGTWSVPGGSLEPGETVVTCAVRELEEETGLRAVPASILPLGFTNAVYCSKDGRHFTTLYVCATGVQGDLRVMEPDKCERWAWLKKPPEPLFPPLLHMLREHGVEFIPEWYHWVYP
jgi:8-oxo-dGTP diphosphatase